MFFKYKAIKEGKLIIDKIQADSEASVLRYLKTSDYFPISIRKTEISSFTLPTVFKKISFTDIVDLTRQLSIMLDAGLTLVDALDILKKQITKPSLADLIENIDKEIRSGRNFSSALQMYPQYFSGLYISLIKAGEASGKLGDILIRLSDNLEKQRTFQGKIKGALVYPAFIIASMFVVGFIMITFVVPKLLELYKDFGVDKLPWSTNMLIIISSFFSKYWIFLLGLIFGIIALVYKYLQSSAGKFQIDSLLLKVPVIGNIIKMSTLVDATRTLSILVSSGVSLLDGLSIVIDTANNAVYKKAFIKIKSQVEKGISLGQTLKQAEIFPPIFVQMTLVGEQTGHLDDTLMRVSKYFESDSEIAIKAMTSLIEPIILVVLGVGVGFLVFAIITPIYNLTSSLK